MVLAVAPASMTASSVYSDILVSLTSCAIIHCSYLNMCSDTHCVYHISVPCPLHTVIYEWDILLHIFTFIFWLYPITILIHKYILNKWAAVETGWQSKHWKQMFRKSHQRTAVHPLQPDFSSPHGEDCSLLLCFILDLLLKKNVRYICHSSLGLWDGSGGKGACGQTWESEFDHQDTHTWNR